MGVGGRVMGEGRQLLKSNRPHRRIDPDRAAQVGGYVSTDRNAAIRTSRPFVSVSPVEQLALTRNATS